MKIRIVPYKGGSAGAKRLAQRLSELLGYKVWRSKPRKGFVNLGWGYKGDALPKYWLNHPDKVMYATDKRLSFGKWTEAGVNCVPWTTDKNLATAWLAAGKKVLARTPCGQGGSGIKVCTEAASLPDAELYTQYVPKKREFRVHVFGGKAILVQEKRKRKGVVDADPVVRSHSRGWVFCVKDIAEPNGLRDIGVRAVGALGLDFGAVDVIYNEKLDKLFCLEVNSAPGLCTATTEAYANEIAAQ